MFFSNPNQCLKERKSDISHQVSLQNKFVTVMNSKKITSFDYASQPDTSFCQTSVLVRAIISENVGRVKFLLKEGCDPNKPVGDRQMRPLMMACFVKHSAKRLAIFKSLFQHTVDPELADKNGKNCLMYTCSLNLKAELDFILDSFVCSLYNADISGNTLLHECAKYSILSITDKIVKKMLSYSMNINIRNKNNHTPLDEAVLHKNVDGIESLCKAGGQCILPIYNYRSLFANKESIKESLARPRSVSLPSSQKSRDIPGIILPQQSSNNHRGFLPPIKKTSAILTRRATYTAMFRKSNEDTPPAKSFPEIKSSCIHRKDPEEILYKLLDLKSRRGTATAYCRTTN